MSEVITVKEALSRINLEDISDNRCLDLTIEWDGYPKPFPGGHVTKNNKYKARVNQLMRGDDEVLYQWNRVVKIDNGPSYNRVSHVVIFLTKTNKGDSCLQIGLVG